MPPASPLARRGMRPRACQRQVGPGSPGGPALPALGPDHPAGRIMDGVQLPVMPPVSPMLAKAVRDIPPDMHYEPKWDGFRAIVFRDGDEVELGSRNERPMTRYFPELVESLKANLPRRCVVDGEVVIIKGDRLEFESLLLRIHPAE